jgi:hypothetical protein
MRATVILVILLSSHSALAGDAESDVLESKVNAYLQQIGPIVAEALMPKLAEHRELGNVIKEFSFRIDASGHPKQIKASSVPPTELLDQLIIRVIQDLKFPPIPKDILEKHKDIEFRTRMGPPGSIGSNQALQPTAGRCDAHT